MRTDVLGIVLLVTLPSCGGQVDATGSEGDAAVDIAMPTVDTSVVDRPDSSPSLDSARDFDSAFDTVFDSAVDTTSPPVDATRPDVSPLSCEVRLVSSFACTPPTAAQKGGPPTKACSEAALQAFATACIAADYKVGAGCDAWKTANAACATCIGNWSLATAVLPGKVYADRDKCWYQLLDAPCSVSLNCMFACDDAVCGDCDKSPGSSTDGTKSEFQECVNRERAKGGTVVPKGQCNDLATGNALKCLSDNAALIDPCIVSELYAPTGAGGHPDVTTMQSQSVVFYRGACRDDGNWTKSKSATP